MSFPASSRTCARRRDSDDIEALLKLFRQSAHTTFDLERKVLMFSNLTVK